MEGFDALLALGGLVAGLMVGLTGMGGAVLVTPLLIVGFGVPATAAVSSDVVAGAVVKPVGALVHARRGTVHWRLVIWLSVGSVPGVLIGTLLFARLMDSAGMESTLRTWIGAVLLVALVAMIAKTRLLKRRSVPGGEYDVDLDDPRRGPDAPIRPVLTASLGLLVGILVGTTSVGSGSLVVTILLLLYPLLRPSVLVGTDLVQAAPMLLVGALAHVGLGDVDWRVTATLLVGQVPGVWLGARMSSRYNGLGLRYLLMVVLAASALKLLGVPSLICSLVAVGGIAVVGVMLLRERAVRLAAADSAGDSALDQATAHPAAGGPPAEDGSSPRRRTAPARTTRAPARRFRGLDIEQPPALERPAEGDLVGVLEVAADRQAARQPGHRQPIGLSSRAR